MMANPIRPSKDQKRVEALWGRPLEQVLHLLYWEQRKPLMHLAPELGVSMSTAHAWLTVCSLTRMAHLARHKAERCPGYERTAA